MSVVDQGPSPAVHATNTVVLSLQDPLYPALLKTIADPPPRLYVRGNPALLSKPQLAIVGARRATAAGLKAAETMAMAAAGAGLAITSGLALGIDGAAHRGALAAGGDTLAVMATGIETIYPHRHRSLGEEIAASGCLVSEFPPGTKPLPYHFPRRNRIISGLSLGVLVVEAALPSGSLITANTAGEQGREVFALPWSIAHQGGAGCLHLLRDGAKMVLGIGDILDELGSLYDLQLQLQEPDVRAEAESEPGPEAELEPEPEPEQEQEPSEENEFAVLSLLCEETCSLDELVAVSGLPVGEVMGQLSTLELTGSVARIAGGYIRTR
ncbi:MAG: DNA-processing protein DprA [Halioglobus sp.]